MYEKTSFIRSNVYIAKQTHTVLKLIKKNLKENKNEKIFYGKDFKLIKKSSNYFYKDKNNFFKIRSNLIGDHMYENIVVAIKIALDLKIPINQIKSGIKKIDIPGRMQFVKKGMLRKGLNKKDILILDGAHNNQQSSQIIKSIHKLKNKNKFCVVSMINTKDPYSFLKPFKKKFKKYILSIWKDRKMLFQRQSLKELLISLTLKLK